MSRKDEARVPVRPGQHIDVIIDGMGHRGEGVGRFHGMAVFIPDAVPGDRVMARVTQSKRGYARASLERVVEPSPSRATPRCPAFGQCGGCQLQHMAYDRQLSLKRQQVVDAVTRIGKLKDVLVHPAIGMDDPWEYRNNAQFPVGQRAGDIAAGFYALRSHEIIDIERCDILHPLGQRVFREMKALTDEYNVPIYDPQTHTGILRHMIVRIGRSTDQAMAIFVTRDSRFPHGQKIAQQLLERIPQLVGVIQNINSKRTQVVLGRESMVLAGVGHITDYIGKWAFQISPESFLQVNPVQTEKLYEKVLEYAALTGKETVFDLYCGIGTISLFLAQRAARVIGIERVARAAKDAVDNAKRNDVTNVRFVAGDAEEVMPRLVTENPDVDVIVVDPPRAGCEESVLDAMARLGPKRIVYVSCNPASLARDLARLQSLGYTTREVQPVDMFPHTAHIECCALLVREKP